MAAEIIMPAKLVREIFQHFSREVYDLAHRFGVSETAMMIRLTSLHLVAR